MADMIQMIIQALPFALVFCVTASCASILFRKIIHQRQNIVLTIVTTAYIGLLLYGTIIARLDRLNDFWRWETPDRSEFGYQLDIHDGASLRHGLFNVALFIPWGICWMLHVRRSLATVVLVLFCGCLMSLFIEVFQVFHRMSFDLGDFVMNLFGTIIGIIVTFPVTSYAVRKAKNKKKQRCN